MSFDKTGRAGPKASSYTVGFRQSKTAFATGFGVSLSSVELISYVLFLEAVGVRGHC